MAQHVLATEMNAVITDGQTLSTPRRLEYVLKKQLWMKVALEKHVNQQGGLLKVLYERHADSREEVFAALHKLTKMSSGSRPRPRASSCRGTGRKWIGKGRGYGTRQKGATVWSMRAEAGARVCLCAVLRPE